MVTELARAFPTIADASSAPGARHARSGPSLLLATRCKQYQDAIDKLERFARFDSEPVLLTGERGTGKTALAAYLHRCSPRAGGAFIPVALSAIPDTLAQAELFGHLPGAFTDARARRAGRFVSAQGGTLFLDEIGKASSVIQHTLLDVVERREITPLGADRSIRVDVRIVAATNVELRELAEDGRFLPDLIDRLDTFVVRIPPLRERRNDIPVLLAYFLALHAVKFHHRAPPDVEPELSDAFTMADWPGNVRQLEGAVKRILAERTNIRTLALRHVPDDLAYLRPAKRGPRHREEIIADLVSRLAERQDVNKSEIARTHGCSRTTIHAYLKIATSIAATLPATA